MVRVTVMLTGLLTGLLLTVTLTVESLYLATITNITTNSNRLL